MSLTLPEAAAAAATMTAQTPAAPPAGRPQTPVAAPVPAADLPADAPLFPEPPPILAALDAAITADIATRAGRGHLGMSQIGKADGRTLWLQFRGCLPEEHSPRTERIFRLGDAIEQEIIRYLRQIPGVELHTSDPEGQQFRFAYFGGHFGGSMDGAIIGLPEASKTWHVFEAKSVSAKRFNELEKKGVQAWSAEYFAQLQCYMGSSGMERALFVAYCKDDSRLYAERVRFEPMTWDALLAKAERLLEAEAPPASSYRDPSWYEAKWMPPIAAAVYWGERLPPVAHCRNCRFSTPDLRSEDLGGHWLCAMAGEEIPPAVVAQGCQWHQWIHALCPLPVVAADADKTVYALPDGRHIANGPEGYASQELAEASKGGFAVLDEIGDAIHQTLDARLVQVSDPLAPNKEPLF